MPIFTVMLPDFSWALIITDLQCLPGFFSGIIAENVKSCPNVDQMNGFECLSTKLISQISPFAGSKKMRLIAR